MEFDLKFLLKILKKARTHPIGSRHCWRVQFLLEQVSDEASI